MLAQFYIEMNQRIVKGSVILRTNFDSQIELPHHYRWHLDNHKEFQGNYDNQNRITHFSDFAAHKFVFLKLYNLFQKVETAYGVCH